MGIHTIPYTDAEALAAADTKYDDHSARHEDTGDDEISVATLSGQLADDQHVKDAEVLSVAAAKLHEATHVSGGSDDIDSALAIAAMANLGNTKIWQGNAGNRPVEVDPPVGGYTEGARAYHNAAQSIATGTWTALALNQERYDTDTIHDLSTNNSRLTCKTAGKYVITGHIRFDIHATGHRQLAIRVGGTTNIGAMSLTPDGVQYDVISIATIYDLAVNEYVELFALQNSGGNLEVGASGSYTPEFAMQRIG